MNRNEESPLHPEKPAPLTSNKTGPPEIYKSEEVFMFADDELNESKIVPKKEVVEPITTKMLNDTTIDMNSSIPDSSGIESGSGRDSVDELRESDL